LSAPAHPNRPRHVHHQQQRQLALFAEPLDEGLASACGDVPVDMPHIVARYVWANLFEFHALATERAAVLAGERRVHPPLELQVQPLDLAEFFGGEHGGRGLGGALWQPWHAARTGKVATALVV
jgi:hypothetical protein